MDELFEYDVSKFTLSLDAVKFYFKNNYNIYFNKSTCGYDIWCNGSCILSGLSYAEVVSYFEQGAKEQKKHLKHGVVRARSK